MGGGGGGEERQGESERGRGKERGKENSWGGRTGHYSGQSQGEETTTKDRHMYKNTDAIHNFQHYKQ